MVVTNDLHFENDGEAFLLKNIVSIFVTYSR